MKLTFRFLSEDGGGPKQPKSVDALCVHQKVLNFGWKYGFQLTKSKIFVTLFA